MSLLAFTFAGSDFGPIRMKSLYMTSNRFTPKPSATNFSSCALACTNTTSASPRRPVSSAWPVPCATTFTSMPVLALNIGRMWPNRPESWVDVVEATTIDFSCAVAEPHVSVGVINAVSARCECTKVHAFLPGSASEDEIARQEAAGLVGGR